MVKWLMYISLFFILVGCSQNSTQVQEEISDAQRKADSLTAIADSIMAQKNLAKNFRGMHMHSGTDLAAQAHQDPKKMQRVLRYKKLRSEGRRRSHRAATEAVQKLLDSKARTEQNRF